MSTERIALGVVTGLAAAALTTRAVDAATQGQEHGVHVALAMAVPATLAYAAGGKEPGTVGRGALYGIAVGGALTAAFVSTFSFTKGGAAGFFGERKPKHTMETDPILLLARKL